MSESNFRLVDVDVEVRGTRRQHKVIVYSPRERLLSYPAIWLGTLTSYNTSFEYAKILRRFCDFLYIHFHGNEDLLLSFWRFSNMDTITAWKTYRIQQRYRQIDKQGRSITKPSFPTIDREADIVSKFLDWIKNDMALTTRWDGKRKRLKRAASIDNMFRGLVTAREREVIAANTNVSFAPESPNYPIEGLARSAQGGTIRYLDHTQVRTLVNSFTDKVWKYICLTGYITGMRPHEVLAVPYYVMNRNGNEFMADPHLIKEKIDNDVHRGRSKGILELQVLGKGAKLRTVKVSARDWLDIMLEWIPLYEERLKLYRKKTGTNCPVSILWLDKHGHPLYCPPHDKRAHRCVLDRLQSAIYYVSRKRAINPLAELFGFTVDYYCLRHTFATNYMIEILRSGKERTANDYIKNISYQRDLADQLGHEEFDTTFRHYIDVAVAIMKVYGEDAFSFDIWNVEKILASRTENS